jgi:hypothetical protein
MQKMVLTKELLQMRLLIKALEPGEVTSGISSLSDLRLHRKQSIRDVHNRGLQTHLVTPKIRPITSGTIDVT